MISTRKKLLYDFLKWLKYFDQNLCLEAYQYGFGLVAFVGKMLKLFRKL